MLINFGLSLKKSIRKSWSEGEIFKIKATAKKKNCGTGREFLAGIFGGNFFGHNFFFGSAHKLGGPGHFFPRIFARMSRSNIDPFTISDQIVLLGNLHALYKAVCRSEDTSSGERLNLNGLPTQPNVPRLPRLVPPDFDAIADQARPKDYDWVDRISKYSTAQFDYLLRNGSSPEYPIVID